MCAKRRKKKVGSQRSPECPPLDVLHRLSVGQLHWRELEAVEGHVVSCPACAAALGQFDETDPLVEAVRLQPAAAQRLAVYRAAAAEIAERLKSGIKRSAP